MSPERVELEKAYQERMALQELEGHLEAKLRNAGRVIAAWEAVSYEVTAQCQGAIDKVLDKTT